MNLRPFRPLRGRKGPKEPLRDSLATKFRPKGRRTNTRDGTLPTHSASRALHRPNLSVAILAQALRDCAILIRRDLDMEDDEEQADRDGFKGSPDVLFEVLKPFVEAGGPSFCSYTCDAATLSGATLVHGEDGVSGHHKLLEALYQVQPNLSFPRITVTKALQLLHKEFERNPRWAMNKAGNRPSTLHRPRPDTPFGLPGCTDRLQPLAAEAMQGPWSDQDAFVIFAAKGCNRSVKAG